MKFKESIKSPETVIVIHNIYIYILFIINKTIENKFISFRGEQSNKNYLYNLKTLHKYLLILFLFFLQINLFY